MAPSKHVSFQSLLDTMRDEKHSLRAEVTKLSIPNSSSSLADFFLLLMDYVQVISSVLFFSRNFESNQESSLLITVKYICQLANPAFWIRFDHFDSVEIIILCLVGLFSILKYLLFGYVVLATKLKVSPFQALIQIWRFVFRIQGRLLYFVKSSLWMSAISAFQSTRNEWTAFQYYNAISISCFMIALDFFFTFYLKICHFHVLPSRKLLSAKGNSIEALILIQKFILLILTVTLDLTKLSNMWIFTLVNLFVDFLRNCYHFGTLPFYSFKVLSFQAIFLMITTSLNLSCSIECLAKSFDETSSSLPRLLAIWIILSCLSVKFALGYIDRRLWDVILNPLVNSPSLLIHRIWAIDEIRKTATLISEFQHKNSLAVLALKTVGSRASDLLKLDSEFQAEGPLDLNNRDLCDKVFEHYLRKLNKLFPKNKFIQLCTAQFQIQRLKAIRAPTEILHKLVKSSSDKRITLSAELLLMEVQGLLRKKYENPATDESLNLRKFIHENILYADVKQKVIEQADLQIKICNQVKKEFPDLAEIFEGSQKLAIVRQKNIKAIQNMLSNISDYHISPLLFCAKYHLILNHSIQDKLHFMKVYNQKLRKYQRSFNDDKLIPENMFGHDVGFILFSNNEPTVGKSIYVSKGFAKRVGRDNDSLMTMNVLKTVPPCLYEARVQFHKYIAKHGEKAIPDAITRGFVYNKQGYLVELDFYLNIHPFLSPDFCISCIERGVISNREYIYVLENGEIDCTTQGIGQKLGLKPNLSGSSPGTNFHLSNISKELVMVSEAFNMVFFDENPDIKPQIAKRHLKMKEAREIFSVFSTYGRDILLDSVTYRCQITNQYLGKSLLKLITLEEKSIKFQTGDPDSPIEIVRRHYHTEIAEINDKKKNSRNNESCDEKYMAPQKSLDDNKTDRFSAPQTTRGHLLDMMTSSRGKEENKPATHKIERFSESTGGRTIVEQKRSGGRHEFIRTAASGDTSKLSKLSHQKRIFYLYRISLNTKYTPKIARIFSYFFWTSLIIAVVSQVLMKLILDENVENLSVKKDILKCVQSRNSQLINVASSFRILWDINSGTLSTSTLGTLSVLLPNSPEFIAESLTELNSLNNELLLNISSLDKGMYQMFFTKDVRVYENYFDETPDTYDDLDSFQATNRIIETASSILTPQGINKSTTENLVHFITRNSLNNLLIKNKEISKVLLASLDSQRSQIRNIISSYFFGLVVLLFSVTAAFIIFSWNQHNKQVINLSAFCRINPTKLNDVHGNFVIFKKWIENDEYQNAERFLPTKKSNTSQQSSAKKEHKNPNSTSFRKGQVIFIGKFVSLMLTMIILIIVTSCLSSNFMETTTNLQDQIYFLDYSQSTISLASVLFVELTATNNVAFVENIPVLERLQEITNEIYQMKRDLYTSLMDAQNSQEILENLQKTLAGEKACETIGQGFDKSFCLALESRGFKPGLAFLLTSYNLLLKEQVINYQESRKTESALIALKNEEFEATQLISMVTTYQLKRLATIIDGVFEERIERTHLQRRDIMSAFILVVIVLGFILQKYALSRLRENVNQFKNVLAVLPADLVLASLRLRTFLMKTSYGALDTVKIELN